VHVQVDHQHAQQLPVVAVPFGLHQARGHRHVVEDAVARALVRKGVVGATGQVGGHTFTAQSAARARLMVAPTERRARSTMRSLQGKPISRCCAPLVCALGHGADPVRLVRQGQFAVGGRQGFGCTRSSGIWASTASRSSRYLPIGKLWPGRQRQHKGVGMEGLHAAAF
jgi:hypothetical protein